MCQRLEFNLLRRQRRLSVIRGKNIINECAWQDPETTACGIRNNAAVNVLTTDLPSSRLVTGCSGNTALVWFEKYTGPAQPPPSFYPPSLY